MSKAIYKKLSGKINFYTCGCCFSGEKNPKCRRVKKALRQQAKREIKNELQEKG